MTQSSKKQRRNFGPVKASRTSESVADAIRRAILDREFKPGEALPPERSLAEQFQVTRNTVREALRALERARLLSIRQGSGARVLDYLSTAGLEFIAELLGNEEEGRARLLLDVAEARQVVGGAITNYAIDQIDPDSLGDLLEAVDAFCAEADEASPDVRKLQELDYDLHNRLVKGAGNHAFILLHNSLNHIYRSIAHLFEPLMAEPRSLAKRYREMSTAMKHGERERAKELVSEVFELGYEAMAAAVEEGG